MDFGGEGGSAWLCHAGFFGGLGVGAGALCCRAIVPLSYKGVFRGVGFFYDLCATLCHGSLNMFVAMAAHEMSAQHAKMSHLLVVCCYLLFNSAFKTQGGILNQSAEATQ